MSSTPPHRFHDFLESEWSFRDLVLVECPRCHGCAQVTGSSVGKARFTCLGCGLSQLPGAKSDGWGGRGTASAGGRCGGCGQYVWRERSLKRPHALGKMEVGCKGCGARTRFIEHWTSSGDAKTDPLLGLPLWLQTPCCGELLWAYNTRHLRFLHDYVAATLREREPNVNASLASRLPQWLKRASNRRQALRGLAELERRVLGRAQGRPLE